MIAMEDGKILESANNSRQTPDFEDTGMCVCVLAKIYIILFLKRKF